MLAARLVKNSHGGDRKSDQGANLPLETVANVAEKFNVSERTVKAAKEVLDSGSKKLIEAVKNGDVSASAAEKVIRKEAKLADSRKKKTDYGKCPSCAGEKWSENEDGVYCSKCKHPHGEPAGDIDEGRLATQRSKTIKTIEALMRAFDDINLMHPKADHKEAMTSCKRLIVIAKGWK
jgi:hypothetical protein